MLSEGESLASRRDLTTTLPYHFAHLKSTHPCRTEAQDGVSDLTDAKALARNSLTGLFFALYPAPLIWNFTRS